MQKKQPAIFIKTNDADGEYLAAIESSGTELIYTDDNGEYASVTEDRLKEQAEIVNNYPADIASINGYSIVNIHPWSISGENLEFFVNQLDEEVVLVTVDELLTMISDNIPHETVTPRLIFGFFDWCQMAIVI